MDLLTVFIVAISSVIASSGFWAYVSSRQKSNSAADRLIMGLGHDKIMYLCKKYIDRGYITYEEYENLNMYLFEPYTDIGGNGSAARLMAEVNKLEIHNYVNNKEGFR